MEFNSNLQNAIKSKNIIAIRSALYTIAHEDPSFKSGKFLRTFNAIKNMSIPGLIDKHEGELIENPKIWSEVYWAKVASDMIDNFSIKRIDHLIEVGKKVYLKESGSSPLSHNKMNVRRSKAVTVGEDDFLKFIFIVLGLIYVITRLFKKGKK